MSSRREAECKGKIIEDMKCYWFMTSYCFLLLFVPSVVRDFDRVSAHAGSSDVVMKRKSYKLLLFEPQQAKASAKASLLSMTAIRNRSAIVRSCEKSNELDQFK